MRFPEGEEAAEKIDGFDEDSLARGLKVGFGDVEGQEEFTDAGKHLLLGFAELLAVFGGGVKLRHRGIVRLPKENALAISRGGRSIFLLKKRLRQAYSPQS